MSMIEYIAESVMSNGTAQADDLIFPGGLTTNLTSYDLAHLVVDGLFGLVFPDPHARHRLDLRAISRVPGETMTWYIWTQHRPGVSALSLIPNDDQLRPGGSALLSLRYFPNPDESLFAGFSPLEQQVRLSDLFDQTGTPRTEVVGDIDPSLFHIGMLTITAQGDHHLVINLQAQDRWVESVEEKGEWHVRRNVPGLALTLSILDVLVCGLSYLGHRPPATVRVWRRPGVVWYIEPDGSAQSRNDPRIAAWEIEHQGMTLPGCSGAPARPLPPEIMAEPPFFEHAGEMPPRHPPWPINTLWWQAAGWQFEPVGAFCGHCAAQAQNTMLCHEFPQQE